MEFNFDTEEQKFRRELRGNLILSVSFLILYDSRPIFVLTSTDVTRWEIILFSSLLTKKTRMKRIGKNCLVFWINWQLCEIEFGKS